MQYCFATSDGGVRWLRVKNSYLVAHIGAMPLRRMEHLSS